MLTLFNELEDQNLSLIQNGQDLEENIDEIKTQAKLTRERLGRDVDFLADQIAILEQSAIREEERIQDLTLKCEMFRYEVYHYTLQKCSKTIFQKFQKMFKNF